jgi:hypothetical protein
MKARAHGWRGRSVTAQAVAILTGVLSGSMAIAGDGQAVDPGQFGPRQVIDQHRGRVGYGTLAYGGSGIYPGFQGFGLSFHLGYGYGGNALGVGPGGGYPGYGGPGYPNPAPPLRRCGREEPYWYYDGQGFRYKFYGPGQLVVDKGVVTEGDPLETGAPGSSRIVIPGQRDYGVFTGVRPYPDGFFAPFTAAAAAGRDSAPGAAGSLPATGRKPSSRDFGIEEELVVDSGGVLGVKVIQVYPESAAEKAGLQRGDIILSANGYLTERPGALGWIMANAVRENVLTMNVRKVSDGQTHVVTARLGAEPGRAPNTSEAPPVNPRRGPPAP